jgi:hypothetical protein
MARSAIIVGRVGAAGETSTRSAASSAPQLPATTYGGGGGGFVESVKAYVDPGETSAAPTFGGAALGALLAPRMKKSPYVGALAGAAVGNIASTLVTRAQDGIQGSDIGKLALTTAAYAGAGAAIAHFSKKAKPLDGALIGMGIPVVLFAAWQAFAPKS